MLFRSIALYDEISDALKAALNFAKENDCDNILFSPASKSYDKFGGYEERGRYFNACVKSLRTEL